VKKSLHDPVYFEEVRNRISMLTENSPRKWGKMTASQMLKHCDLVLKVALRKVELPAVNILFKTIGAATKIEMQVFNNGIKPGLFIYSGIIADRSINPHVF
jgi:hypothetical protein